MNMRTQLFGVLALVGITTAFSAGCAAHAQASGVAEAEAPVVFTESPTLVAIDGDVWVVRDAEHATYYVEDGYWVFKDDVWYRSKTYDGGWIVVEKTAVPVAIVTRQHALYVHYHGDATAQTRPAPRGTAVAANDSPPAAGNPHGGAPGHEELPGVGNQRKAEGEQPGNAHGATPAGTDGVLGKGAAPADAPKADAKDAATAPGNADGKKGHGKGGPKKK